MKKIITSALVVMATTLGFSQKVTYGVKGGLNISSWRMNASSIPSISTKSVSVDTKSRLGFYAGGLVEIPFSDKFSYQVEVLYVQNGVKTPIMDKYGDIENIQVKLHQVNSVFLLKYEAAHNFKINGGGYLGALLGGAEKYDGGSWESYDEYFHDNYKTTDYGLIIGAEYNFPNKIFVDARYNLGLASISNEEDIKVFNRGFQVGVGYKF